MGALQEYVEQRGLEMDPTTRSIRRPRTCIISTSEPSDTKYLDNMLTLQDGKLLYATTDTVDEDGKTTGENGNGEAFCIGLTRESMSSQLRRLSATPADLEALNKLSKGSLSGDADNDNLPNQVATEDNVDNGDNMPND